MAFPTNIATSNSLLLNFPLNQPFSPRIRYVNCVQVEHQVSNVDGIMCESCNDKGWLLCDFCNGQKINVRAENNRIYRRCPSCRAIGSVLCSKCKVYKCVTFPDQNDGEELNF